MPKSILTIIADNELLFTELRKVFDDEFSGTASQEELGFSNERLGERVRARLEGKALIERAFEKIASHQTVTPKVEKENPAR